MIRNFGALVVLWLVSIAAFAKNQELVGKQPDWVITENFNPNAKINKANVSDGWLNILIDQQINIGKETNFYHYTRKICSNVGVQNASEIAVNYEPNYEKLRFHYINIYRNGQKINKLDPAKIKVMHRETNRERFIYDGVLTAALTLDDVREGDIIDYAFSYTGNNPIFEGKFSYSFYLQLHDPLDKMSVRVIAPESRKFNFKNFGYVPEPIISQIAGNKIYSWKLNQIPGLSMDDNVPNWYDPYPWVSISEYQNWQQVNDWALRLFAYPETNSKALSLKIDSLKNRYSDAGQRVDAALKFVQNDIRYLGIESGISSHKPFAPAKVFEQRYGDCKDKANLLCFMLNQLDIKAWPVLVNTQSRQEIKKWLPGVGVFDHCVVQVEVAGKKVWLDPTSTHQTSPYDKVYFPNYGAGLVIKPGTVALTNIPQNTNSKTVIDEQFTLDAPGKPVSYRVETNYSGYEAEYQREYFGSNSLPDVEKGYLNYYAEMYPGIKTAKEILTAEDVTNNAFMVFENYEIDNFWEKGEKNEKELNGTIYPQVVASKIVFPKTKIRTMPYQLEFPLHLEQTTQIFLPEPWPFEEEDLTIAENGIFFSKKVTKEGLTITLKYVYKNLKPQIEAKNIAAYIATQKKIQNHLGYTFTQSGGTIASDSKQAWSEDKNPLFLVFMVFGLGIIGFLCVKMYKYDPLPKDLFLAEHPLQISGWLVIVALGLGLTTLGLIPQLFNADYLSLSKWESFGDAESALYNPVLRYVLAGEFIFNLVLAGYAAMVLVLFLKRRSNVPFLMICFYAANAGINLLETAILSNAGLVQDNSVYTNLAKAILGAAIWIPYFLNSKRVKQTFVNTLQPYPTPEEPVMGEETVAEVSVREEVAEEVI